MAWIVVFSLVTNEVLELKRSVVYVQYHGSPSLTTKQKLLLLVFSIMGVDEKSICVKGCWVEEMLGLRKQLMQWKSVYDKIAIFIPNFNQEAFAVTISKLN